MTACDPMPPVILQVCFGPALGAHDIVLAPLAIARVARFEVSLIMISTFGDVTESRPLHLCVAKIVARTPLLSKCLVLGLLVSLYL